VKAWHDKTPKGFIFAAKIPQVITHEKFLRDCKDELKAFLKTMDNLGDKLGPLLFQFRYYRKAEVASPDAFIERLGPFLKTLPGDRRFALEVRNKTWVNEKLLDLLRTHHVAFALTDHPWMEKVDSVLGRFDVLTADFTYIRWLGDRKGIEQQTQHWDKIIIDRTSDMKRWIPAIRELLGGGIRTGYAYFNNHYAGYAPGSIQLFEDMWDRV
jgi:uncharacterized protein YecE (DUF72 family)